jgi:TRAP-type mannitol/chloroaromatic compound transport system permease large subunit
VVIGALFSVSLGAVVAFCVAAELLALPLILRVRRQMTSAS